MKHIQFSSYKMSCNIDLFMVVSSGPIYGGYVKQVRWSNIEQQTHLRGS